MSGEQPEDETPLEFELVENPEPRPSPPPPPSPPKPARPPRRPPAPPAEAAPPPPSAPEEPPHAVRASAELKADILHRDRRGRLVGERFGVACPGERELIHAVVLLSHLVPLSGVRWWTAETGHLLEASGEGLAPETLSARLDAALAAFRLAAPRPEEEVRLYVGGRGLFVPYTGQVAGWDVGGSLPPGEAGSPQLLDPDGPAGASWTERPAAGLLPRIAPRERFHRASGVTWLLVSGRIFPAILSWLRQAGLELSFALLQNGDDGESVLIHVEGLRPSDRKLFEGLPEVDLLCDPLVESEESREPAKAVPPVLVDHLHELPLDLTEARFLTDAERPVVFRAGGPPLVLDGPILLAPGASLLRPELTPAPQRLRPSDTPAPSLHLPLRLVRRAPDAAARRTRALLLTPADLEHLAVLRDHLPWAVTSQAQMAQFDDVAFVLLGEEASWNLPIGLPYWGDDAEGVYLARGWTPSPEVPAGVLRRAAEIADAEVAFLSPARLWCVPRQAFQPLADRIELRRDLSRIHLCVEAARLAPGRVFPELEWPVEVREVETDSAEPPRRGPVLPATRSHLLEEAKAAIVRGELEKGALLFERAGEFVEAAQIYDQMLAAGAAP